MIIKNTKGQRLELGKNRLVELSKEDMNCFTTFYQIRQGVKNGRSSVWFVDRFPKEAIPVPLVKCYIGCCRFSPATFAKILKAAGVKVARKKKK